MNKYDREVPDYQFKTILYVHSNNVLTGRELLTTTRRLYTRIYACFYIVIFLFYTFRLLLHRRDFDTTQQ